MDERGISTTLGFMNMPKSTYRNGLPAVTLHGGFPGAALCLEAFCSWMCGGERPLKGASMAQNSSSSPPTFPSLPSKQSLRSGPQDVKSSETEKCSESLSFSNKTRTRGYSVHTCMLGWLEGPGQKATHHARARTGKVGSGPEGQGSCPGPVSFRLVTLGAP